MDEIPWILASLVLQAFLPTWSCPLRQTIITPCAALDNYRLPYRPLPAEILQAGQWPRVGAKGCNHGALRHYCVARTPQLKCRNASPAHTVVIGIDEASVRLIGTSSGRAPVPGIRISDCDAGRTISLNCGPVSYLRVPAYITALIKVVNYCI